MQRPCGLHQEVVSLPAFPYPVEVSCDPLKDRLKEDPDLRHLLDAYGTITLSESCDPKNLEGMRWMLTPWMPYHESSGQWMAVSKPFGLDFLVAQTGFKKIFFSDKGEFIAKSYFSPDRLQRGRVLKAIELILNRIYGKDFSFDPTVVFISDQANGLSRYYHLKFDTRFLEVSCQGACPLIDDSDIERLSTLSDSTVEDWLKIFPVDRFSFKGFSLVRAIDATVEEALAGVQRECQAGTIVDQKRMNNLQSYLKILTGASHLSMKVFSILDDQLLLLQPKGDAAIGCMIANSLQEPISNMEGTCFEAVLESGEQAWFRRGEMGDHPFQGFLMDEDLKDMLLVPLEDREGPLGFLSLSVKDRQCILSMDPFTFSEVLQAFSEALRGSVRDLNQRVQNVIQEYCTVLHPSVRWRFDQEARLYLKEQSQANFDQIQFKNVYPLFSESDIQSSSHFRNEAIRSDLTEQLRLAREVLEALQKEKPMPILGEVLYQLGQNKARLDDGLSSSDEFAIQQFLKGKVEQVFEELVGENSPALEQLDSYRERLDPRFGMIHEHREVYENTVNHLNHSIAAMIEEEQGGAQGMIPHYAEKNLTDGVELSLYIGEQMLDEDSWSLLHLHNLRLWQLMLTCTIARRCESMLPSLGLPLRMTHLILVQDMPLTIRFSTEEKEFVVDGAYNIRYEIMKKRIDKATIAGTEGERLTQPRQIAIVYSHTSEAELYRGFFDYLINLHYISAEVEELELDELQSLQGLKALRVTVLPERRQEQRPEDPDLATRLQDR